MKNYICKFVGGPKEGIMTYVDALVCCDGKSEDYTEWRNHGAIVPREELDNQPTFNGYIGPMWDGTIDVGGVECGVLRYETQEVYDLLSM